MQRVPPQCLLLAGIIVVIIGGCHSIYYNTMEKFGYQKREILVDRVKDARNENKKTAAQFNSTLAQFNQVVNYKGGELEEKYEKLRAEFGRCEASAEAVRKRIAAVENVGEALLRNGRPSWSNTPTPNYAMPASKSLSVRL